MRYAPGSIPRILAAYSLTASQVSQAMTGNDYIAGLGNTKGQMIQVNLTASTNLHTLEEFQISGAEAIGRRGRAAQGCRQGRARQ